jgi:hypothetical protein
MSRLKPRPTNRQNTFVLGLAPGAKNGLQVQANLTRNDSPAFEYLNIQIHHFQRIFLDEFAAALHVFTHQRRENFLGGRGVVEAHLE